MTRHPPRSTLFPYTTLFRSVTQDPYTCVVGIAQDPIRAAAHVNRLDDLQRGCVPHSDRLGGGKSMVRLGIDRSAPGADIRNRAGRFQSIQVEDRQSPSRATARDIQTARFRVGENVVITAFAGGLGRLQYLVKTSTWGVLG